MNTVNIKINNKAIYTSFFKTAISTKFAFYQEEILLANSICAVMVKVLLYYTNHYCRTPIIVYVHLRESLTGDNEEWAMVKELQSELF